ncbi:MAG: hypothetical protein JNL32_10155 [Candidatus Kapabacteria bacterium]|nr:hypothetical protein [Candidatus Kapabacteria bacterium]
MDTKSPDPQGRCVFDVTKYPEGTYTVQFKESARAEACSGPTIVCKGVGSPKAAGFKNGVAVKATGAARCGDYACSVRCDGDSCNILTVVISGDTLPGAKR